MNSGKNIFLFLCLFSFTFSSAQPNLTLLSHVPNPPGVTLAGVWQYVDSAGTEYALVGASTGIHIYNVSIPTAPTLAAWVPGNNSIWREVKTWGKYAYVTTEAIDANPANNGLQIINLSYLPDSAPSKIWRGDGPINNQLQKGHTVTVANGYVYINGSNLANGGVIIADLSDPWNPVYAGQYAAHYVHDSYVRPNILWTSEVNPGQFSVVDISVPANPVVLNTEPAFGVICHNGWLSDNGNFYFAAVEVPGQPLAAYDVSDINNITLVDTYFSTDSASHEVHNVRVLNDFLINACYGSQVTIVDAARPHNLIQVGNYFTGGSLCWDVSPFLPSGNILATDEYGGFYIFAPTYVRACYLEGIVKDSLTGNPINNAQVQILSTTITENTNFIGNYATGTAQAGSYNIQYSATGYITQTFNGVTLSNGVLTTMNVVLLPIGFSTQDISGDNAIRIFPIPVTDKLVVLSSEFGDKKEIEIYDVVGQKVFSELQTTNSKQQTIDVSLLSSGIYFITVTGKDQSKFTKKFVKN
jgi:choice-of-anchor B domain-containing protein